MIGLMEPENKGQAYLIKKCRYDISLRIDRYPLQQVVEFPRRLISTLFGFCFIFTQIALYFAIWLYYYCNMT